MKSILSLPGFLINRKYLLQGIVIDVIVISVFVLIPTISHIINYPMYLFDPMKIILLLAFLSTKNENVFFLIITIPISSWIISGHPIFPKFILIILENLTVFTLYLIFYRQFNINKLVLFNLAIIIGKLVYYSLKTVYIKFGILQGEIFSTNIKFQLASVILLNLIITLYYFSHKKFNNRISQNY